MAEPLFKPDGEVRVIGHRHGEKMHETLMTEEELAKAEDLSDYCRVPADDRDLNYRKFFDQGSSDIPRTSYASENTDRLDLQGTIDKLMSVDHVRQELDGQTGRQD